MAENNLTVPLDELEDENQMIFNDLEFSQKRTEFMQNYRKVLIEFSANCVCNQNKPLINSIESLETQYKQLFDSENQIECKSEVNDIEGIAENDFPMETTRKLDETDCESIGGKTGTNLTIKAKPLTTEIEKVLANDKTSERTDIKTTLKLVSLNNWSEKSGNSALVFNKLNNTIVRKSAIDINRKHESVIEKLVIREETDTTSETLGMPSKSSNMKTPSLSDGNINSLQTTVDSILKNYKNLENKEDLRGSINVSLPSAPSLCFTNNTDKITQLVYNRKTNTILRKRMEYIDETNELLIESFVLKEIKATNRQTVHQMQENQKEPILPPKSLPSNSRVMNAFNRNTALSGYVNRNPKTAQTNYLKTYSNPKPLIIRPTIVKNGQKSQPLFLRGLALKTTSSPLSTPIPTILETPLKSSLIPIAMNTLNNTQNKPIGVKCSETQVMELLKSGAKEDLIIDNQEQNVDDDEEYLSVRDLDTFTDSVNKLLKNGLQSTNELLNKKSVYVSESVPPLDQQIKDKTPELIDLTEDTDSHKVTDQISKEQHIINLVPIQSSNTCSVQYVCKPVVSQTPHIKFQIPRDSNVIPKGVPSALVMPPIQRPPTLVPVLTHSSSTNLPFVIPGGSNLFFVPNANQSPSTQLETNQIAQNDSQTNFRFGSNMKFRLFKVSAKKGRQSAKSRSLVQTKGSPVPILSLKVGVRELETGKVDSFILRSHESCLVYKQKVVLEEGKEESTVMFRCLKCGFESNQNKTLRHIYRKHINFSIPKLRQMIESGDCFLTQSENYKMCSVIRKKYVNQENGRTVIGTNVGFKCNYPECRFVTNTSSGRVREHLRIHERGNTFECVICEKLFGTRSGLNRHKNVVHNIKNNPPLKCDAEGCDYQTHSSRLLKCHKVSHQTERPYICTEKGCDKTFKNNSGLCKHRKKTHLKQYKLFHCNWPGCNKTFKKRPQFKDHILVKHKEPDRQIPCDLCGKVFKSEIRLSTHKNLLHNIKNRPWIKCPHCPYRALRQGLMDDHLVVHMTRRPFKCNEKGCKKSFKSIKHLNIHKVTHSDERPFPCDWPGCDLTFKKGCSRKRHMKSVHMVANTSFW